MAVPQRQAMQDLCPLALIAVFLVEGGGQNTEFGPSSIITLLDFGAWQVGSITNVRFTNITATSENGIFVSGCPESSVDSLSFEGVSLELVKTTKFLGGYRDYRPSQVGNLGILDGATAALVLEHVNHVTVKSTKVTSVLAPMVFRSWLQSSECLKYS